MSIKTNKLNELFTEWENEILDYKDCFVRDGIIDEKRYDASKLKILFVAKEPNDPKHKIGDFRDDWNKGLYYSFAYRIAEWSYGILNDFPQFDEIKISSEEAHNAIKSIAFMNIKKSGGGGVAHYSVIFEHYDKNRAYLLRQIEIIKPELIILGISFWGELRKELFPDAEWKKSGYGIDIGIVKEKYKIIDFYHPSSRTPPSASYCLLHNIFKSNF